jgi:MFS family permease
MMFGCGAGLAFPPGIFIVTSYFVKYRGFANGVAISGSCLGSMFLPPFLGYLIDNYGYKYKNKNKIPSPPQNTCRILHYII